MTGDKESILPFTRYTEAAPCARLSIDDELQGDSNSILNQELLDED